MKGGDPGPGRIYTFNFRVLDSGDSAFRASVLVRPERLQAILSMIVSVFCSIIE